MTSNTRCCETCRWWVRQGARLANAMRAPVAPDTGTCQLHAPVLVANQYYALSAFPETHASRFCGEWTSAEGPSGGGEKVVKFERMAGVA